jgi:hypothetical protein
MIALQSRAARAATARGNLEHFLLSWQLSWQQQPFKISPTEGPPRPAQSPLRGKL